MSIQKQSVILFSESHLLLFQLRKRVVYKDFSRSGDSHTPRVLDYKIIESDYDAHIYVCLELKKKNYSELDAHVRAGKRRRRRPEVSVLVTIEVRKRESLGTLITALRVLMPT